MSLILAIDASTKGCSVAIFDQGELVTSAELFSDRSSSGMLTTLVSQAAGFANITLHDLDAIAVAKGPGSYTGLRIAVSTAKGLCFGLDKPLLSYNTLEAMTHQVIGVNDLLCPMLDARRMEVYCALYEGNAKQEVSETQALIVDELAFSETLKGRKILFFGEGALKCKPLLEGNPNAIFTEEVIHPSARFAGKIIHKRFVAGDFEDLAAFEPFYLKEFMVAKPKQIKKA